MNQQQCAEPSEQQTMTQEEAKAVVALWSQTRSELQGVNTAPTLADVAEALEITPDESQRLLRAVQSRRRRIRTLRQCVVASTLLASLVAGSSLLLLPKPAMQIVQTPPVKPVSTLQHQVLYYRNARYEFTGDYLMVRGGIIMGNGSIRVKSTVPPPP